MNAHQVLEQWDLGFEVVGGVESAAQGRGVLEQPLRAGTPGVHLHRTVRERRDEFGRGAERGARRAPDAPVDHAQARIAGTHPVVRQRLRQVHWPRQPERAAQGALVEIPHWLRAPSSWLIDLSRSSIALFTACELSAA